MALSIIFGQEAAIIGDIQANCTRILNAIQTAKKQGADMILFPEMALSGYPLEDLLFKKSLYRQVETALLKIQHAADTIAVVIGHPSQKDDKRYNSASVFYQQQSLCLYHKQCLPNESVFDEKRYFCSGTNPGVFDFKGVRFGILICEDAWHDAPCNSLLEQKPQCILSINASPFFVNRQHDRHNVASKLTRKSKTPLLYVNACYGQDELIFDGTSFAQDASGELVYQAPFCQSGLYPIKFDPSNCAIAPVNPSIAFPKPLEQINQALIFSLRAYMQSTPLKGVVIGLSGGIDSGLSLSLAVEALGADRVQAVMLKTAYTSAISLEDAKALSHALKVRYQEIDIEPSLEQFHQGLQADQKPLHDITLENLQARTRAVYLMAFANNQSAMVLNTSNKSELAVGYGTIYGDMIGGFSILKDLYKTQVYQLARYRNQENPHIPIRMIERAPSAELKPNQTDQDTLPAYDILDQIIQAYLQHQDPSALIKDGIDATLVQDTISRIQKNEFKRKTAAIGPRLSNHAFGKDWRMPIMQGFNGDTDE